MMTEDILKVTCIPPGLTKVREIACIRSEVSNLIQYLDRRGYTDIRVWEKIQEERECHRGGEV